MIKAWQQKKQRQLAIVSQLRTNTLSSRELEQRLAQQKLNACSKTIQRDIRDMRQTLHAPIDYDETERGYCLANRDWTFPTTELDGDYLFASLFAFRLSQPVLPPMLQDLADTVTRIQLAACLPEEIKPDLLATVIPATSSHIHPDPRSFNAILDAWRDATPLQISYTNRHGIRNTRTLEPHALFLNDAVWYIRAYCHHRKAYRSFAIHRCQDVRPLPGTFARNKEVLVPLQGPNPHGYEEVHGITLHCSPAKAIILRERTWLPGQQLTENPDGSLTLRYPKAPKPLLLRWVLSYAPHLTLEQPKGLRAELAQIAQTLHDNHQD